MKQLRLQWIMVTVAAVLWACAGTGWAHGQATNTGTVVGQVTDPSGALVPDAKITLTDAGAGITLYGVTNDEGKYAFPNVPPGTYTLTAAKPGFSTTKSIGLSVNIATQLTMNVTMKVGGTTETVEVQVTGTELQTLNSTVGQTIPEEAIDSLPSLLHDVNTFTAMQPGVDPTGSVAGAVNDQTTFLLDGGQITNDMDGSMAVYTSSFAGDPTGVIGANDPTGVMPTPQDSIEEVKVNTANQTADFDNSAGAQVEFVTPRGTNRWHGGAYEYYLDNGFDANTWDNNQNGIPLTQYHYSRFGAKAGGFILPAFWGGRTYLFGFFEGFRYPRSETFSRAVPSPSLMAGTIYAADASGNMVPYNLKSIDPRGIGLNPDVAAMWSKYEPKGTISGSPGAALCGTLTNTVCDGYNAVAFIANMSIPQNSNDLAFRVDHAFNSRWNWFASYRYYKLNQLADEQVDIGGFFPGDKLGVPAALANRPQQPWYLVTGLTTSITTNLTNDFHYSFLRNFWQWGDDNAPPQISGLGGALEPGGENATYSLIPFNVNTQSIRTRFWDGQDNFFSDNLSLLKGNHLLQFGGQYQHNYNYHERSDNGGGINFTPTYQLGDEQGSGNVDMSDLGGGYPSNATTGRLAAAALGIVTDSQVAYTRSGPDLALNPPLTHAFDQMRIDYYNAYFSDSWHMKPSLTLTYGIGYTLEMPPVEQSGKSTVLVDAADEPVVTQDYLAQRKAAAEQGQSYNPELGFALVNNVGSGDKYPYDPFYGSFSPRIGAAWNPGFSKATVIRGGYGRIYGRLNGVDLVLVPLLGTGLIQAVQCRQNFMNGTCGGGNPTAANAFRIGVDGNTAPLPAAAPTLPQPAYPGYNLIAGAAAEAMDPHFRPNVIDSLDLTVQRQIGQKSLLEVGYIGRIIHHEYQPINLNAVPYMMAQGGQQFQTAYANLERYLGCATSAQACGANVPAAGTAAYTSFISSVPVQSFFESALKASGYCNGYASCTAAVLDQEGPNGTGNLLYQQVWSLWSDLDNGNFNFPRTMMNTPIPGSLFGSGGTMTSGIAENSSVGYGNYNGGFISFGTRGWHGLTMQHNFTYSKALGTGADVQATSEYTPNDPYDLRKMYGLQNFYHKFVYNTYIVAQEPWFKGQRGLLGRAAGGWEFSPVFTAGSGTPLNCITASGSQGQAFGAGDGIDYADNEQCVFTTPYHGGHSAHFGVSGSNGVGTATSATPVNYFANPAAVFAQVRAPILGIDTQNPGQGPITGMPYWNLDGQVKKDVRIAESTTFEFSFIATNLLNHRQFLDAANGTLCLCTPSTWGVLNSQLNPPRQMEFGGRITF
ncbi:MAG TPA: carboxypeptidase-like regulatory domain-containing protein [Acidobacteriaceae bacterium]|nr:carboxypeptidase-like regulatory domain-containing protein [Acidobacteriaceae bacterium]